MQQVRGFERGGLNREQAEALAKQVTELLCVNKEKITDTFVSKFTLEKVNHQHSQVSTYPACKLPCRLGRCP